MRVVGGIQLRPTGRPVTAYGRRCKPQDIEHEIHVAWLELYFKTKLERCVKVGGTECDAAMTYKGRRCYTEVDNSQKMPIKQMQEKWKKYHTHPEGYILVVSRTERRMFKLLLTADLVKDRAFFNTFDRLKAGKRWVDWYGKTVDL